MPPLLSPLPGPSLDLNPRIVERAVLNSLPSAHAQEMSKRSPRATALPAWPQNEAPAIPQPPNGSTSHFSILPAASASSIGIYPLPQDVVLQPILNQLVSPVPSATQAPSPFVAYEPPAEDFTDHDLRLALEPLAHQAIRQAIHGSDLGVERFLEPMLRSTIRRALAEHSSSSRHFRTPKASSRFFWHLQALFTSRTYEDILFEKTRRFQVEEVFLLDASSLAMISFASCDPVRHGSPKRISGTSQKIGTQLRNADGTLRDKIKLCDQLQAISCSSKQVVLTAVVRGQPSQLVMADLEFAMNRIEERFRTQFQEVGSPLLHAVQPFLEDCLLIQAPASAA
jgi:hypothetical protein